MDSKLKNELVKVLWTMTSTIDSETIMPVLDESENPFDWIGFRKNLGNVEFCDKNFRKERWPVA